MRVRKNYGDKNIIGKNVIRLRHARGMKQHELLALLQLEGLDINPTALSDLEGQNRIATDRDIQALLKVFKVSFEELCAVPSEEEK